MYKKILVTLDGSELSEAVFPYAKELAGRLGLEVVLLHVCEPEDRATVSLHRAYIDYKADMISRQSLEVQERVGQGNRAVLVRGELAMGYPAEEILRFAEDNAFDMILMATHGRSGIRRWVMGSVAEKVLSASKVPVLLVRAGIPESIAYDKWPKITILVPLDGSELGEAVLPHVEALVKQRGPRPVEVVLLMVYEPLEPLGYYPPSTRFETPGGGSVPVMPEDFVQGELARRKLAVEEYLAGIVKRLSGAGLRVTGEVREGDPAAGIIDFARETPFNLIAMTTHARSGLSRWALGSVAAKVLRGATSPILLVRTQEAETP